MNATELLARANKLIALASVAGLRAEADGDGDSIIIHDGDRGLSAIGTVEQIWTAVYNWPESSLDVDKDGAEFTGRTIPMRADIFVLEELNEECNRADQLAEERKAAHEAKLQSRLAAASPEARTEMRAAVTARVLGASLLSKRDQQLVRRLDTQLGDLYRQYRSLRGVLESTFKTLEELRKRKALHGKSLEHIETLVPKGYGLGLVDMTDDLAELFDDDAEDAALADAAFRELVVALRSLGAK